MAANPATPVRTAFAVNELGLDHVEVQAARFEAAPAKQGGQVAHDEQIGDDGPQALALGRVALEDGEDRGVGQPLGRLDERRGEGSLLHPAFGVDLQQHGHGPPLDPRPQAADVVRQPLRQHGQGQAGEIDRGGPVIGLQVEAGPGPDVVGHVGDVDAEQPAPVAELPHADRVVEVLRRLAVDGEGRPVAEVGPGLALVVGSRGGRLGFRLDFGREGFGQPVAADHHLGVDTRILREPQHAGQDEAGPVHGHDHARLGVQPVQRSERDLLPAGRVEGGEMRPAVALAVEAEQALALFAQNADDPPFGPPRPAARLEQDLDLVAAHGPLGQPGRDVHVAADAALDDDKPEAAAERLEAAAGQVGFGRQEVAALDPADEALAFELEQAALDLGPLLARRAELAEEVRGREPQPVAAQGVEDLVGVEAGHGDQ